MSEFQANVRPPVPPGAEYLVVSELPYAERALFEALRKHGGPEGPSLVRPGARFVLWGRNGITSLTTEEGLLGAIERMYVDALKQGRTQFRADYVVTPAVLEKIRALEVELPKRYAGAPTVN